MDESEHVQVQVHTKDDFMFTLTIDKVNGVRASNVPGMVTFGRTQSDRFFVLKTIPLSNLSHIDGNVH